MLPLFRRRKEWLKWVLLLVIVALGVTTVLLFVDTPGGITGGVGVQEVAVVAGNPITASEFGRYYRRLLEAYRELYNLDRVDPEIVRQLGVGQQALNQLIQQYATSHAAERMGLDVAPDELIGEISRLFQENGAFIGTERYKQILRMNNLSTREFEEAMRRDLLALKLRNILTDGIVATPDEVRRSFLEENQEVRVRHVAFDPAALGVAEISDEQLREFFEERPEEFREEERRRITYTSAFVPPTEVAITPEDIEEELADVPAEEQVRARHILLRVPPGDDDPEARRRAEDLARRIRAGADFEELAREYSEDTASAAGGGDLGFFGRGQMVPEFESVAFAQDPGQVSEPVLSPFGFHIIQTIEKTGHEDATRRPVAEFNARVRLANERSGELAEALLSEIREGAALEEVAESHSLEVVTTPLFDRFEGAPVTLGADFDSRVFTASVGDILGPFPSAGRHFLARVDEIVPSRIPDFEEVRDEVAERFRRERGETLAMERADEFFAEALSEGEFEAVAQRHGLPIVETDWFRKGTTIDEDGLRFSPEVHDQAFSLDVGDISTPIPVAGRYFVFQVVEKSSVDESRFEREKPSLRERLTEQKRNEFFNAYVQNIVSSLRRDDKIAINQRLVDDLTG
jgi:peptidyl-prolyl cis-trans isomerase D